MVAFILSNENVNLNYFVTWVEGLATQIWSWPTICGP